jgi:NADPH2:quinone reductase
MKAAYIRQSGPPEAIEYGELPLPPCAPDQILVRVAAVSVNPIDTYIRGGANYWPLPSPFILGCDFAGTVIEVGREVRTHQVGQRVWGSNQGLLGRQGTFAETIAIDPKWAYSTPEGAMDRDMAAIALVGITAHLGLFSRAQLKSKETLFVRGGTGGVSSMVIQMAKAVGASVITTAGSADKAQRCLELGADHVIEYNRESLADRLKEFAPEGVNVFWETLREPDFDFAVSSMASNARMILMAGRDARPPFPVGPFYVKGCSLHGFAMFKESAESQAASAADINHWVRTGALRSQIDRVLPLEEAAQAHRLQEQHTVQKSSTLAGKIVLEPNYSKH